MEANKDDLRALANGLIPGGFDATQLTPEGRDEVRDAIDVLLKLSDQRNVRLTLALGQLDRAAVEIERLQASLKTARFDAIKNLKNRIDTGLNNYLNEIMLIRLLHTGARS